MNAFNRRQFLLYLLSVASLQRALFTSAQESKSTQDFKLGCFTRPWDAWDIETALDGIAKAGFEYCGLMTAKGKSGSVITPLTTAEEARQILNLVQKRKLKILCVYGEFGNLQPSDKWQKYLKQLLDNVAACESPFLLLGGTTDKNLHEKYYETVQKLCDYALWKKITITVKPHGGTNATSQDLKKISEFVNKPNFKIWYDPGNIFYYSDAKINPLDDVIHSKGIIAGCSIKDYRHPKDVNVTPGNGMVNFYELFKRFKKLDFTNGPLLIECLAKGDFEFVTNEAKMAKDYIARITKS
ncbi:MAG: sugar phosphate isomerase/epimerase [Verrucomicrobiae bacterium]|nr:sugar phosphate isomerase/epimerase [Verrucomicrobiae bacterium]